MSRLLRRRLRRLRRRLRQMLLRGGDQRGESFRVVHRHVRQNLAVDLDAAELESVNQLAVGGAVIARRRSDALNPQRAEIALAISPVAITVAQRAVHRLFCRPVELSLSKEKPFGVLEQFFAPCAALGSTFY